MRTGIVALFIGLLAMTACDAQKSVSKTPKPATTPNRVAKQDSAVITISRTPCYGKCPAYSMSVFANGKVTFEGQRDVSKIGLYTKSIGADSVTALVKKFEDANVWHMEDTYPNIATDLPTTIVSYRKGSKYKMVKGIYKAPDSLLDIVTTLYKIADSDDGWLKTGNLPMQK